MFGNRANKRSSLIIPILVVFLTAGGALAFYEFLFELGDPAITPGSANITDDTPDVPDWSELFDASGALIDSNTNGVPNAEEVFGGLGAIFLNDQLAVGKLTDDTIFASSNKNNDAVSTWNWDTGNVPVKDDIANAYAYATLDSSKQNLFIFTGLERLAPEGASHVDIELNLSGVGLDKAPPCGSDESAGVDDDEPCEFVGSKQAGDILVVMDFEQGGRLGFVEVRTWDPVLGYVLKIALEPDPDTESAEGCNEPFNGFPAEVVCAVNNNIDINSGPWPSYDRHGNIITTLPPNGFTEVGINLSALLGGDIPCLSSIQIKTRSSPSFNSELKDFVSGDFDICGSITVIKETVADPVDGADFGYSTTNLEPASFSLDDDDDPTLLDTIVFSDLLEGDYTVIEDSIPSGWELTDLTCEDPTQDTVTNNATADIALDFGEDVTCTYTNTKLGTLIVRKETDPAGSNFNPEPSFEFTFSGDPGNPFNLLDGEEQTFTDLDPNVTHTMTESSLPDGWDLYEITCDDSGSSGNVSNKQASYDLSGGNTVKCTFKNRARGSITIEKNSIPDDPQTFNYSGDLGDFTLDDDGAGENSTTFADLIPGSYSVTESLPPSNWDFTGLACVDPTGNTTINGRTADIEVDPGEEVICTYENTKRGSITIVKDAVPNDPQLFSYTGDLNNFSLDDDGIGDNSSTFTELVPGTYSVTESGPPVGWEFTSLACIDPTGDTNITGQTATIEVDPGEDITCTYTNTKQGKIIIDKVTIPSPSTQSFEFDPSYSGNFFLTDAATPNDSGYLSPNTTYTVTEVEPPGWILKTVACDDTNSTGVVPTANIVLDVGETVTCTFTNIVPSEGCTPGYWKNHLLSWPTGYNPTDLFVTHFGVLLTGVGDPGSLTLIDALNIGGGGKKALTRHATAALLNAAALEAFFRPDQVIDMYNDVYNGSLSVNEALKILSDANELGCPLS